MPVPLITGALLAAACLLATAPGATAVRGERAHPISLHPENPHYFLFRGKPTLLITSAEHYGAVLNADFQGTPYLKTLQADGMNLTRVFSGAYVEPQGAFNIRNNTLAPAPGRFLSPWRRSTTPGYAGGGEKFDLTQWDDAYFKRLREFVREAGKRGVVVEYVLFCPYYDDAAWSYSPLNARNNINGGGEVARTDALTLKDAKLLAVQEAFVRKAVAELREFDNVYFEICNEPYFGGVTLEWQSRIAATIADAEAEQPPASRHLIAQNIANGSAKIESPNPAISVFNFHYSNPPDSVGLNYALDRVIGFDETGFKGTADTPYRTDGWEFVLAGGGVYNHLDYSFTVEHPEGTAPVTDPTPGGGGPTLRRQLRILSEFMRGLPFTRMRPDNSVVRGGVPAGGTARVLAEPGKVYALYLRGGTGANLELDLPAGRYEAEWVNPLTGAVDQREELRHAGGVARLVSP
ncbi:MAG TPA: hypothetical protein VK689_15175, partial [Armatimonadota bacterium]|nr:hypothetical protein [Armatimonadota bacterium]